MKTNKYAKLIDAFFIILNTIQEDELLYGNAFIEVSKRKIEIKHPRSVKLKRRKNKIVW